MGSRKTKVQLCLIRFVLSGAALEVRAAVAEPQFNYAEALQKSLYFFETQQSGDLSPFRYLHT